MHSKPVSNNLFQYIIKKLAQKLYYELTIKHFLITYKIQLLKTVLKLFLLLNFFKLYI